MARTGLFLLSAFVLLASQITSGHWIYETVETPTANTSAATRIPKSWAPIFLTDLDGEIMRCNTNNVPAKETLTVEAGDEVVFRMREGDSFYHPGPAAMYLGVVPEGHTAATWDGSGQQWFKVGAREFLGLRGILRRRLQVTYGNVASRSKNGQRAIRLRSSRSGPTGSSLSGRGRPTAPSPCTRQSHLKSRLGRQVIYIPLRGFSITLEPQYLLRAESLSFASAVYNPQWWISCAQIKVVNGGNGQPPLVAIPGHISAEDPNLWANTYKPPVPFRVPGPDVWPPAL
ncbi:hypothetical protein NMY22_g10669 [Coprinellus aureogranulatus]|nr:hypothetical protein NMY22_g10669 [Coprinellus aureogranulatus]